MPRAVVGPDVWCQREMLLWKLSHMVSGVVDSALAPNFKTTQL